MTDQPAERDRSDDATPAPAWSDPTAPIWAETGDGTPGADRPPASPPRDAPGWRPVPPGPSADATAPPVSYRAPHEAGPAPANPYAGPAAPPPAGGPLDHGAPAPGYPGPQAYPGTAYPGTAGTPPYQGAGAYPAGPGYPAAQPYSGHPGYPPGPGYPQPGQPMPSYGPGAGPYYASPAPVPGSAIAVTVVAGLTMLTTCLIGIPSFVLGLMAISANASDPARARSRARTAWIVYAVNWAVVVVLAVGLIAVVAGSGGFETVP